MFGWVFASHQIGASIAALGAGLIRDQTGSYDPAFYLAAGLCVIAAVLSLSIRRVAPTVGVRHEDVEYEPTS